jgi:hypothetical protein
MDDQVAYKFSHASIKVSQVNIKKYITYLKKDWTRGDKHGKKLALIPY